MPELKSCPFCGHGQITIYRPMQVAASNYRVAQCDTCFASVPGDRRTNPSLTNDKSERDAATKWNRRAPDPEIARLRAVNAELLATCEETARVVDEAYEATGFIKVAKSSHQRMRIEAVIAKARAAGETEEKP